MHSSCGRPHRYGDLPIKRGILQLDLHQAIECNTKVELNSASSRHHTHHLLSRPGPSSSIKSDVNQSIQYREATSQRLPTIFRSLRRPPRLQSVGAASGNDQELVPQEQARLLSIETIPITIGSPHQFVLVSATRTPCNATRLRVSWSWSWI